MPDGPRTCVAQGEGPNVEAAFEGGRCAPAPCSGSPGCRAPAHSVTTCSGGTGTQCAFACELGYVAQARPAQIPRLVLCGAHS